MALTSTFRTFQQQNLLYNFYHIVALGSTNVNHTHAIIETLNKNSLDLIEAMDRINLM